MNARTGLYALVALNLASLAFSFSQQLRPALAQGELPVLRGRALEIVDGQGRVRASISVLPPSRSASGEEQSETVLLRLITERGRPTVKIRIVRTEFGIEFCRPDRHKRQLLGPPDQGHEQLAEAEKRRRARASLRSVAPRATVAAK